MTLRELLLTLFGVYAGVYSLPSSSLIVVTYNVDEPSQRVLIPEEQHARWSRLPLSQPFSDDLIYTVEVSVGTPPQRLRLQIDIASPDTFLDGAPLLTEYCTDARHYHCAEESIAPSSSSRPHMAAGRRSAEIRYGGYLNATGEVEQDVFRLGQLQQIAQQAFLHAHDLPARILFRDPWCPVDGMIGFAPSPSRVSSLNASNPFLAMAENGSLDVNLFTLRLREPAELMIGRMDTGYFTREADDRGEIVVLPMRGCGGSSSGSSNAWQSRADSLEVETGRLRFEYDLGGSPAVFSTRSASIYLPDKVAESLTNILGFEDHLHLPPSVACDRRTDMPDLTFNLDGRRLTISAYDYTLSVFVAEGAPRRCLSVFKPTSLLDDEEAGQRTEGIILGSAFLRAFYSIFDLDTRTIGLIKLAPMTPLC